MTIKKITEFFSDVGKISLAKKNLCYFGWRDGEMDG